jgi:Ca2+-binding RTX toxin-like protein
LRSVSPREQARPGQGDVFGSAGAGGDTMQGGYGNDTLRGDDGDIFVWSRLGLGLDPTDSRVGASRDVVEDFTAGDRLDVSRIDAVPGLLDDAFAFIGGGAFTSVKGGIGLIRHEVINGNTIVQLEVTGDDIADMDIQLNGIVALTAQDFIL